MEVYIVIKKSPIEDKDPLVTFNTIEGVFATYTIANRYVRNRLAANDRDDKNCDFTIEIWNVQKSDTSPN